MNPVIFGVVLPLSDQEGKGIHGGNRTSGSGPGLPRNSSALRLISSCRLPFPLWASLRTNWGLCSFSGPRLSHIFYCYLSSCSFSFRAIFCMSSMCDSSDKTLMLGKIEGRRRQGRLRTRCLGSITNSMDMSLSKLREIVKDKKAWHAVVHRVAKSWTRLSN